MKDNDSIIALKKRAQEKLIEYKAKILEVYPELTKVYGFKRLRLIFAPNSGNVPGQAAQAWRASATVELGLDYLEQHEEEVLGQLLGHEIAHVIAPLLYGDKGWGHTPKWKSVMKAMGLRPETYHYLTLDKNN